MSYCPVKSVFTLSWGSPTCSRISATLWHSEEKNDKLGHFQTAHLQATTCVALVVDFHEHSDQDQTHISCFTFNPRRWELFIRSNVWKPFRASCCCLTAPSLRQGDARLVESGQHTLTHYKTWNITDGCFSRWLAAASVTLAELWCNMEVHCTLC